MKGGGSQREEGIPPGKGRSSRKQPEQWRGAIAAVEASGEEGPALTKGDQRASRPKRRANIMSLETSQCGCRPRSHWGKADMTGEEERHGHPVEPPGSTMSACLPRESGRNTGDPHDWGGQSLPTGVPRGKGWGCGEVGQARSIREVPDNGMERRGLSSGSTQPGRTDRRLAP